MTPAEKIRLRVIIRDLTKMAELISRLRWKKAQELGGVVFSIALRLDELLRKMK